MARKRDKPEEIVLKLRQVEVLQGQGKSIAEVVRQIGVTHQFIDHDLVFVSTKPAAAQCWMCAIATAVKMSWRHLIGRRRTVAVRLVNI